MDGCRRLDGFWLRECLVVRFLGFGVGVRCLSCGVGVAWRFGCLDFGVGIVGLRFWCLGWWLRFLRSDYSFVLKSSSSNMFL